MRVSCAHLGCAAFALVAYDCNVASSSRSAGGRGASGSCVAGAAAVAVEVGVGPGVGACSAARAAAFSCALPSARSRYCPGQRNEMNAAVATINASGTANQNPSALCQLKSRTLPARCHCGTAVARSRAGVQRAGHHRYSPESTSARNTKFATPFTTFICARSSAPCAPIQRCQRRSAEKNACPEPSPLAWSTSPRNASTNIGAASRSRRRNVVGCVASALTTMLATTSRSTPTRSNKESSGRRSIAAGATRGAPSIHAIICRSKPSITPVTLIKRMSSPAESPMPR